MNCLIDFLRTSYTAYHAVENAEKLLLDHGFSPLFEGERWQLSEGGKYYVIRNGSSLIAFTVGKGSQFKVIASHTDSPCFKLKEHPVCEAAGVSRLNVEPYGGSIHYSFFDRPLRLAGRLVQEEGGKLIARNYCSDFNVVIPSLAIHQNREVNDKFAPNAQVDLLPLLSLNEQKNLFDDCVSYDLFAVCAEQPFSSGVEGELLSSPRIDNLTSVLSSLEALCATAGSGVCVAACLDNEEVGSSSYQGAGSDFLKSVLTRIARAKNLSDEEVAGAWTNSLLVSLDNAHAVHPNRPEKSDPTNRVALGGGIVVKGHAGRAYTTDAVTSAIVKTIFKRAGVKHQTFYNRSDIRSGGTLGTISLSQIAIPSVDLGIAQLAMHSAVETFATKDYEELKKGLRAFYQSEFSVRGNEITLA